MKLPVYKADGALAGTEIELDDTVFGIEPNEHVMYLAVKAQRAHMRQGTHSSKNRSAVAGGGRKPWRQKGRGAARAGTVSSPIWRHGGTTFGPLPHPYVMKISKKVNRLARISALSVRASEDALRIIEDFSLEKPSTKEISNILDNLQLSENKVLILTGSNEPNIVLSANNLAKCNVRVGSEASTYDLLNHRVLLIQSSALQSISEVLGGRKRTTEKAA
ncbi:MAG: 50S ribosomal protein L4 [Candidatus Electryonea clarkiae]|nr:50S ribosomal protein L4 [Candidatus Electryonea clarkiae]MDP8288626.1 50S ribosomal protein L4 [Candidatus Electryonea clarkiae]